ncbi:hypothetical protein BH24ACT3_BH24ACT3_02060 [soil metagenome]
MTERTSSGRPLVSVVIPTYHRPGRLAPLLTALASQTLDPDRFEVLVVDDGTTDETAYVLRELVERTPLRLRTLRNQGNCGPARARNVGWRSAAAAVVAFTDDDYTPTASWLEAGLRALDDDPGIGIVQRRTDPEPGQPIRPWVHTRNITELTLLFEGCNLFVRREALDRSAGFDGELAFLAEDTALGWRVLDSGWSGAYADDAVVHHEVTYPPLRKHLRLAYLEGNLVKVARDHPGIRHRLFWRPWAFRPLNAWYGLALGGLLFGTRRRWALLAAAPYAWARRPPDVSTAAVRLVAKKWPAKTRCSPA